MPARNITKGFTLIELSLVLVIIGLIVGGVLVGRDLIKSAEIRAQIKQVEQYTLAYNTFKLKYACIPGDCKNATDYFTGTANGDGDGIVESSFGYSPDVEFDLEQSRFFEQLSLANLIPGKFSSSLTLGIGFPATILAPKKGFVAGKARSTNVSSCITSTYSYDCFAAGKWNTGLFFFVGNPTDTPWTNTNDSYGLFTPAQTQSIDQKLDDGFPHSGVLRGGEAWDSLNGRCSTGSSPPSTYLVTNTDTACVFAWKLD
ncbi:MAG: prepilin-type N-terminal cleavage/methylation domain-containing protein [Pseudomonadota bacterium]